MRQIKFVTVLSVLALAPAMAASAAIVTVADDTILVLPSDGSQYTMANGSAFEQLIIDGASFIFNMIGGESVTLTSADKRTLTSNPTFPVTCGATQSSVVLTLPTGGPAQPITVTPGATCSSGGGGGSPSIGQVTPVPSSGGGGSPPPPPSPAPTPKATSSTTPTPPTPSGVGAPTKSVGVVQSVFFKNLSRGNRGDAVRELQTLLRQDKTIYPQGIANGVFGPATTNAVKKFQQKYGIKPVNGRVGPLTRAKLMQVFGGQKTNAPAPVPVPAPAPAPQPASRPVSSDIQALKDQLTQLLKELQELQKNKR